MSTIESVCVTGGTGFLASQLIKQLLEKGYFVKTTVRDLTNQAKYAHLTSLEGASERLQVYEADLMKVLILKPKPTIIIASNNLLIIFSNPGSFV